MIHNPLTDKVEFNNMKMPQIIVDSDDENINKSYDNELYDTRFLDNRDNESNFLCCKSNLDDADSGIHESNEIFLPAMGSSMLPNRLSLRDMKKRSNLSEIRSLSTNCLPLECKEGIDIIESRLCRNCSTKMHSKVHSELYGPHYSVIEVIRKQEINQKPNNQQGFQHRFCRIRVLLIGMKILLGSTMTAVGIYLFSISNSIKLKDCAFWASGPLLLSGLYEVFIFNCRKELRKRIRLSYITIVSCAMMSLICSILCLLSSIYSGIHGNWISGHSENCYPEDKEKEILDACCYDYLNSSVILCHCQEMRLNSLSPIVVTMMYHDINCRYLFSAVKDYLILQCSLMGIGSGVCLWVLQMTIQRIIQEHSLNHLFPISKDFKENTVDLEQSPVLPLKVQLGGNSEMYQEFIEESKICN